MSVMIETSLGEVVIDLFCDEAPLTAKNFLKLCKIKYYNGCLFYNVQQNFMIQTGDPTATGRGGTSVYGLMYGEQARFFEDEIRPTSRRHDETGLVSMANMGVPNSNGSQFFFSMRGDDMQHLDGKHTVFAKVMEGMETLEEINSQFCDDDGRPYRDIRILHTYVLDDPFEDPPQLVEPDESPQRDRPEEERVPLRLGALDKVSLEQDEKTELERERELREKTARSNAVVLEMIGDLPDADIKPPENVLFVCKLNPVTTDDDLEIIFTRFGPCRAEICRDHITGDSLNYAFVEFEAVESCEEAFKKMNNVLIDDRRIRVDFSQSVSREWYECGHMWPEIGAAMVSNRSKYKSRVQGGQKLASGKGGKPIQQKQEEVPSKAATNNGQAVASADRTDSRRSKWGNALAAAATTTGSLATARDFKRDAGSNRELKIGASGRGDDNDHGNGRRQGDSEESRNVGSGGGHSRGGTRRDKERGRDDDGRREKDIAGGGEHGRRGGGDHHKKPSARGDAANREDGRGKGGRQDSRDRGGKRIDRGVRDGRDEGSRRDGTRHGRDRRDDGDHSSKRSRRDDSRDADSRRSKGGDRGGGRSKDESRRNGSGKGKEDGRAGERNSREGGERDESRKRSRKSK